MYSKRTNTQKFLDEYPEDLRSLHQQELKKKQKTKEVHEEKNK